MISFYTLSKRLHLKLKGLFDARIVSLTENVYRFTVLFCINS